MYRLIYIRLDSVEQTRILTRQMKCYIHVWDSLHMPVWEKPVKPFGNNEMPPQATTTTSQPEPRPLSSQRSLIGLDIFLLTDNVNSWKDLQDFKT